MKVWNPTDEEILAAVLGKDGRGGRTHVIAARMGVPLMIAGLYRRLIKLERAGKVERDPRYSYVNSIYWRRAAPNPGAPHDR